MTAPATRPIRVRELAEGRGRLLEFGKPPANILDRNLMGALGEALAEAAGERSLRFILLTGSGEHFSYGASVPEHLPGDVEAMLPAFHDLLRRLDQFFLPPVIAAVRGRCLGGGLELALACDLLAVHPRATLGCPEIQLGVFPPAASALLPLRLPAGRASALILSGGTLSGEEAMTAGLADFAAGEGPFLEAVEAWADARFGRHSAVSLRHARSAARWPWRDALERILPALEQRYLEELMALEDPREGLQAFLEKRKPVWGDC